MWFFSPRYKHQHHHRHHHHQRILYHRPPRRHRQQAQVWTQTLPFHWPAGHESKRWGESCRTRTFNAQCFLRISPFSSLQYLFILFWGQYLNRSGTGTSVSWLSLTPNALPALKSAFFLSMSCSALACFSCLFLFFQAKNVSRVIRVTSAPRAARYNKEQMLITTIVIDNYQIQWHCYFTIMFWTILLTSVSINSSREIISSFISSFFLSFFRTKPTGRAWRYIQLSLPPGQTQNQPYLLFSIASRKNLHTLN